ncbi:MAG: TPM domain-containing protein [Thalassovita sp.]
MKHWFVSGLVWLCVASASMAQSYPDYENIYVNDYADLLGSSQESDLISRLSTLRNDHGIEFTVITINRMSDFGHSGAIEPFATGLFNHWGVGDAAKNDGVMMLIARYDRTLRIEVGSGYGTSKNQPMQAIIDGVIIPEFKEDRYARGIIAGVDEVILNLTGEGGIDLIYEPGAETESVFHRFSDWILMASGAGLAGAAWRANRVWQRRRPRLCPVDGQKMHRIRDEDDDAYLTGGRLTEEKLKSVDYDIWECPTCAHHTILSYKRWFSNHGVCRSCGFQTVERDSTILKSATTSSTGLRRLDYHCQHCDDQYSVQVTTPRVSKSSSSSSGSFGGGSSSGGGASGSW